MNQIEDILDLLRRARMDYNAGVAKINDALTMISALPAPPDNRRVCPVCGVTTRGPISLDEHVHLRHGGPLPEAWARAEQAAGLASDQ